VLAKAASAAVIGLEGDSSFLGAEADTPGVFFISDYIGTSEGI
jgi:hypothetical protein